MGKSHLGQRHRWARLAEDRKGTSPAGGGDLLNSCTWDANSGLPALIKSQGAGYLSAEVDSVKDVSRSTAGSELCVREVAALRVNWPETN